MLVIDEVADPVQIDQIAGRDLPHDVLGEGRAVIAEHLKARRPRLILCQILCDAPCAKLHPHAREQIRRQSKRRDVRIFAGAAQHEHRGIMAEPLEPCVHAERRSRGPAPDVARAEVNDPHGRKWQRHYSFVQLAGNTK